MKSAFVFRDIYEKINEIWKGKHVKKAKIQQVDWKLTFGNQENYFMLNRLQKGKRLICGDDK